MKKQHKTMQILARKKCTCNQYVNIESPCCEFFKALLNDCNSRLYYSQKTRLYGMELYGVDSINVLNYCFCCGSRLPKSLVKEWYTTLEKEFGITDPRGKEADMVSAEFQTDEWWKKRGL